MNKHQQGTLNEIRSRPDYERAVVFLHGFSGDRDDTWDRLPSLLGTVVADWDIYTLGYATTFRPDILGVWSADPDLPILATMLTTQASIDPLRRYKSLAVVAHSMGGLVLQRALVDDPELANRTEKVVLFGTPKRRASQGNMGVLLEAAAEEHGDRERVHYNAQTGLGRTIRTRPAL